MGESGVPHAAEIDAAWLTDALSELHRGATVVDITATSIGTGQVGENVRFELTWDRDGEHLPPSVVGKFPSTNEVSRAGAVAVDTYVREVGFYRDLRDAVTISAPTCHRLEWDPATHAFVVLMNDLRDSEQGDQLRGCSIAEAEAVVAEAVGLHAPTWGRTEQLRSLDWLGFPSEERTMQLAALTQMMLPGFIERFTGRLSDDDLELGRLLIDRFVHWSGLVTEWATGSGDWCVAHGDYRLDNLLLGRTPEAPAVTVVDWQTVAVGIGPADVAYFIGAGLLPDDRRAHERRLVDGYAAGLRDAGVTVTDDAVWEGYVLGSPTGYHMAIIASMLVEQTERGDEMFAVMAERHAGQVRDVGLLDLL